MPVVPNWVPVTICTGWSTFPRAVMGTIRRSSGSLEKLQNVWTPSLHPSAPRSWRGFAPRTPALSYLYADLSSPWGIDTGSTQRNCLGVRISCFVLAGRSFLFTGASGIGTKIVSSRGCLNPEGNSGSRNWRAINSEIKRTWSASLIAAGPS